MPDELTEQLLDILREEAVEIGADLIRDGVDLVREHLEGQASDAKIMEYLRRAQEES